MKVVKVVKMKVVKVKPGGEGEEGEDEGGENEVEDEGSEAGEDEGGEDEGGEGGKLSKVNKKVKVNKRFSCTNHLLRLLDKLASVDGFQERSRKYEILTLDHL